jgi:class 3 adenylate cyclase/ActR/RegA family two-component response regulator
MADLEPESDVAPTREVPSGVRPQQETRSALSKIRHDLRTPLNQIIGYTEMLQEVADPPLQPDLERVHKAAHTLVKGIDHALEAVSEMLGLAVDHPGPASVRASLPPPPPGATTPSQLPLPATSQGASLLVVDDIEMNRTLLHRRLTSRGFKVDLAESGERALEMIAERPYDLVLLDVMMPGLSGIDVLKRVRETTSMSELPIIMATARDGSSDVVEALECGANDYVTKPIDVAVLLARANSQLALKAATEKIRKLALELEVRNKFIRDAFGRYVTDEVVDNLLATPNGLALGGESRTVTVMMSDLRGFSSISERLTPPNVVALLNHYLGAMTEIIMKYGGTIDEFIGDAILVIFGAPMAHADHAARAVACAIEMQLAMESVNEHNRNAGLPRIEMGIGINTGEVVVGNIGSDRRAKYGVVGRSVNMASRIEALTIGGQVLVSETTMSELGGAARVNGVLEVSPKGAKEPLRVFDIGGISRPYNVALTQVSASPIVTLDTPLPIKFAVLNGVHAPSTLTNASVSAVSAKQAVISTTDELALMSTVKFRFDTSDGMAPAADAYAKVVEVDPSGSVVIHFTSMPPDVEEFLAVHTAGPRSRL